MSDLNGVMMQYFHWYTPDDGSLWNDVAKRAPELAARGVSALWLPPAYKGAGGAKDVGYAVYDLYDLGEFDQQGSVRTKYGTRDEYLNAIQTVQKLGMQVYADIVLNHRCGGEATEVVHAIPYAQDDRRAPRGPARDIHAYTKFDFPGRNKKYSSFSWNAQHFDAVDYDALRPDEKNTVYLIDGKSFDKEVALEKGNYAHLLGCDCDMESGEVRAELLRWGKWYLDTTGVDGFRLDAVKHISAWFFPQWIDALEQHAGKKLFVVGEYWEGEMGSLVWYLDRLGGRSKAFCVPLHYRFHAAGNDGNYDLRQLLDATVTKARPEDVVTFVDNHDSQPLQALESPVASWFKPLAYAMILLRREGYPCLFHPDYFGAEYDDVGRDGQRHHVHLPSHKWLLDRLLFARLHHAWGPQIDYVDHWNRVGWTRLGDDKHPLAMAVLINDGPEGSKWMDVARPNAKFIDLTEHVRQPVFTNEHGWGDFRVNGGSVSVWVQEPARDVVDNRLVPKFKP